MRRVNVAPEGRAGNKEDGGGEFGGVNGEPDCGDREHWVEMEGKARIRTRGVDTVAVVLVYPAPERA